MGKSIFSNIDFSIQPVSATTHGYIFIGVRKQTLNFWWLTDVGSHFPWGHRIQHFLLDKVLFELGHIMSNLKAEAGWTGLWRREGTMMNTSCHSGSQQKKQGDGSLSSMGFIKKNNISFVLHMVDEVKDKILISANWAWTTHTSSSTQVTLTSGKLYKTEVRGSLACAAEGVEVWGGQSWGLRSKCIISRRRVWIRIFIGWYRKKSEWLYSMDSYHTSKDVQFLPAPPLNFNILKTHFICLKKPRCILMDGFMVINHGSLDW